MNLLCKCIHDLRSTTAPSVTVVAVYLPYIPKGGIAWASIVVYTPRSCLSGGRAPGIQWTGYWVGFRADVDGVEKIAGAPVGNRARPAHSPYVCLIYLTYHQAPGHSD